MTTDNRDNAVAEVDIRERIDSLLDAVRTGDLETLRTVFAPNIVSFDIEAPLRHLGEEKKMSNWEQMFTVLQVPFEYETRDLTVFVDGSLAIVYSLNHMNASIGTGGKIDYWLRWTSAWQKIDGQWMIVHDHVSVPTYFPEGRAAMDLMP
ncbi:YybH family protein [Kribbella pratensis]|jgi:ketosteroid isomerase-like protein|uniref:Ketosteroid isomerase-like protein n=1 Tax=Kribbella pratensis TaxID=2512112 RepID=A0A4R8CKU6_9ACTN|nr:nuclear transport factor 2 family protein [Kribbella pratensis]TDW76615.1 ketosteroid isomerase-like protein [Kribbella pratensis]